eukprot:CAMPEP_0184088144 /NCGR_PEP_ID=MMETSP0974-20121125/6074_1 /TAXON_ID=483370 /ORGANISM="non described non described, Strain CCMP2097" /LENGTH=430 /DNA_ID=CAMNT_0026390849 /DNA_START=111 /DNA_END=1401 /DNA_ORIENTATION=-
MPRRRQAGARKAPGASSARDGGARFYTSHSPGTALLEDHVEDAARDEACVFVEGGAGLHVRVREIRPNSADGDQSVRRAQELLVHVRRQLLPALEDGQAGHGGRPFLDCEKVVAMLIVEPPVAVPAGKGVVADEERHCQEIERRADHSEVGGGPHELSDELRVARDSDDARLPEVELWDFDGCDFFEVEDGRVKKKERRKADEPGGGVRRRDVLAVPEHDAVVRVRDEVRDPRVREAERRPSENDAPRPRADDLFAERAERREARVDDGKDDAKGEGDEVRIAVAEVLEPVLEVVGVSRGREDPEHDERAEDGAHGGAKSEPAAVAERAPLLVLPFERCRVLADTKVARAVRRLRLEDQPLDVERALRGPQRDPGRTPCGFGAKRRNPPRRGEAMHGEPRPTEQHGEAHPIPTARPVPLVPAPTIFFRSA